MRKWRGGGIYRRLIADRRGAAAIETAFALPIFLLCVFIIMELGRLAYTQGVLMFAAEETTRYATVHYDATAEELTAVAAGRLYVLDPKRLLGVDVDAVLNEVDQTKLVTIGVRYHHDLLIPLLHSRGFDLTGVSRGFLVEK